MWGYMRRCVGACSGTLQCALTIMWFGVIACMPIDRRLRDMVLSKYLVDDLFLNIFSF